MWMVARRGWFGLGARPLRQRQQSRRPARRPGTSVSPLFALPSRPFHCSSPHDSTRASLLPLSVLSVPFRSPVRPSPSFPRLMYLGNPSFLPRSSGGAVWHAAWSRFAGSSQAWPGWDREADQGPPFSRSLRHRPGFVHSSACRPVVARALWRNLRFGRKGRRPVGGTSTVQSSGQIELDANSFPRSSPFPAIAGIRSIFAAVLCGARLAVPVDTIRGQPRSDLPSRRL